MRIPGGGAPLDAVKLLLEKFESLVQIFGSCFVEAAERLVDGGRRTFKLLHHALRGFQLTLEFLHRGLVSGSGGFCYLLFQTAGILFELCKHLLCLFAVDGEDYIGGGCIISHNSLLNTIFNRVEYRLHSA